MTVLFQKPFRLELDGNALVKDGERLAPDVRKLGDMGEVLREREFLEEADPSRELYYMYRAVAKFADIRYDITIIPPSMLGSEYVKTYGHYHPPAASGLCYCEIYEVLSGEAHYLLQKERKGGLEDFAVVRARKREKVIVPPDYGHVTVNASRETLVMANLVYEGFESDYKPYAGKGGAAYYETTRGLLPNQNYNLRGISPTDYSAGEFNGRLALWKKLQKGSLLELAEKDISLFEFLKKPELCR